MPAEPTPHPQMDPTTTQRTAEEMAALVRVQFGVRVPREAPAASDEPAPEPLSPAPRQPSAPMQPPPPVPVAGIPVPQLAQDAPVAAPPPPAPVAPPPPAVAPASLPVPDVPQLATPPPVSVPGLDQAGSEQPHEPHRRPVGPSLELLQEIAFLDE